MSRISLGVLCALGCLGAANAANAADHQLNEQLELREALEISQALEVSKQHSLKEQKQRDAKAQELAKAIELSQALELSKQQALKEQQLRENETRELAKAIELSQALELSKQQALKEQQLRENETRELAKALELSQALELSKQQALKEQQLRDREARELAKAIELSKRQTEDVAPSLRSNSNDNFSDDLHQQKQLEIDTAKILDSLKGLGMPLVDDYQPHISEVEVIEDVPEPVDLHAAMGAPVQIGETDLNQPFTLITSTKKVDGIAPQEKSAIDVMAAKQEEKQIEANLAKALESLKGLGMPLAEDSPQKYISEVSVVEDVPEPVDLYAAMGAPVQIGEADLNKPFTPITSTKKVDGIGAKENAALDVMMAKQEEKQLEIDTAKILESLKGLGMPLVDDYQPHVSEVEVIEDLQEPVDLHAAMGAPVHVDEADLDTAFGPLITTEKVNTIEPQEESAIDSLVEQSKQASLANEDSTEFDLDLSKVLEGLKGLGMPLDEAHQPHIVETEVNVDVTEPVDINSLFAGPVGLSEDSLNLDHVYYKDGLASIDSSLDLLSQPVEEQPQSALLDSLYSVKANVARGADAGQDILAMQVGDEFEVIQDKHMPWLWAVNRETGKAGWINFANAEYTQRSLDLFKRRDLAQLQAKQAREAALFTVKSIGYFDADAFEGTEEIERLTNTKVFSLEEGELFYITDYSEDWWEAIDAHGNTGIVASNLVEVVEKMTDLEHSALERHTSIVSPKHAHHSMDLTHVKPDLIKGTDLKSSKYKLSDEKDFYFRARLLSELHAQNAQIFGQSAGSLEGIYAGVDWQVGDKIQSGAFGAIYPITFTLPSSNVIHMALKVISNHKVDLGSINNELALLKKFNGHPRFVPYYGSYQTREGDYIIAMALMEGDIFDEKVPYTSKMFNHVVDALAELRKEGIFHGDIKAENVLHNNGQYYMADLGGSKQAYYGVEHPNVAYTLLTSAPEVEHIPSFELTRQNLAQENPYLLDPFAADVFSAGMTLILKKHDQFAAAVWKSITDERDTYASAQEMDRMYKMTLVRKFTALVQAEDASMDAEDTLLAQMVKPSPEERITVAELQRSLLKQRLM
ncbi:protein kinase [Vibrio ostreicida]|uniref:Protein kinase n=1 Tax=Vibrio ostreicida TaxID=526588 RepID=A0ABT8BR00_9VIBR|nr:protein kinase [Vibrio ostreicida]MDN3609346.1 protein kinase [Vibrio ostreicida]NPD08238.1 protein kinase [Vibrio ostreicida]